MAKITAKIKSNFAKSQTAFILRLSDRQIEAIARKTEQVIQGHIADTSIKRGTATGNLAVSFTTVKITYIP